MSIQTQHGDQKGCESATAIQFAQFWYQLCLAHSDALFLQPPILSTRSVGCGGSRAYGQVLAVYATAVPAHAS